MKIIQYHTARKLALILCMVLPMFLSAQQKVLPNIKYIDYFFENASFLSWDVQGDTIVKISLMADYEREMLNRQSGHWYFRLEAEVGAKVRFILSKIVPDVYNGRLATDWWNFERDIPCYISYDQKTWKPLATSKLPNMELLVEFIMKGESVYVSRTPPYTENDLEILKKKIKNNPLVKIIPVGHTIEKRALYIIRLGNPETKYNILLRARAHPWETGGNWVIEGLINDYLKSGGMKEKVCYYIMPMANKDGIFHGMTRFNMAGRDLNRNWLDNIDSICTPENYALEKFITNLIDQGHKPVLAIDFHNDDYGNIHLTMPKKEDTEYLNRMGLLRNKLIEQTWFSQKLETTNKIIGGGNMADGLYYKFDIEAFVFELNANYIESLGKIPEISDWIDLGSKLNDIFHQYLNQTSTN